VVCWHFLLFGLLLRAAVSRRIWRLQFCAQQELVVLCFVFCLFWHCTLVHFGLFSSLNLMMRSSPACLRKKQDSVLTPIKTVFHYQSNEITEFNSLTATKKMLTQTETYPCNFSPREGLHEQQKLPSLPASKRLTTDQKTLQAQLSVSYRAPAQTS
jgi:hypothetical protein